MKTADIISVHDQEAILYDKQVQRYGDYAHDALFGMSFEYVNNGDRMLDLGIGTGLASRSFAKMGVDVYGCDGSEEMLKICKSKRFTKDLKVVDFQDIPLPYSNSSFDHVICCGVLHFFDDLGDILNEVMRIIKAGGIFSFSYAGLSSGERATSNRQLDYVEKQTKWGVTIFKHSCEYISKQLNTNEFNILKVQKLCVGGFDEDENEQALFNALVTRSKK